MCADLMMDSFNPVRQPNERHHGIYLNSAFLVVFDFINIAFTLSHFYYHSDAEDDQVIHTPKTLCGGYSGVQCLAKECFDPPHVWSAGLEWKSGDELAETELGDQSQKSERIRA